MTTPDREHVEVATRDALHAWLLEHHGQVDPVRLGTRKKAVAAKHVPHQEVLDELIAFGWIDSSAPASRSGRSSTTSSSRGPRTPSASDRGGSVRPLSDTDVLTDAARLGALRALAILDTSPERDYDDLAAMAASVTGSPVAAVNFVDDERHFTKAVVGAPHALGASVANGASFCAATIGEPDGVLVVADTAADPRFQDHPVQRAEPPVRFYAGAAIHSDGQRVGVVCAWGPEPRELTVEERKGLLTLARQAEAQLRLRRRGTPGD